MRILSEFLGWLGAVMIHSATLPTLFSIIWGGNPSLPELSFVLLIWGGLVGYLVRAIATKDLLHIVSNAVGFGLNSVLLIIIVFGG